MKYDIMSINGVKTVFAELADANSTTIEIFVKAGSIYETKQTNGISHFLEHMFFKGGLKYRDPKTVAETVDAFGGEFNAYTGDENAGYYIKCAPQYVPTALDVLSDMLVNAQFPIEEMEREKGVIIQEIRMYEDMPQSQVVEKWQERYYGDNPFGWSTLGPVENIKAFTQDHFFAHKQSLYTKDNLIVVIAGALPERQKYEDLIGELFNALPEKKTYQKPVVPSYRPALHEGHYAKNTQQVHYVMSADGFNMHDQRRYALNMLGTLLGWTMSSRLRTEIREKRGLCYYINARHVAEDDQWVFLIRAGLEKERFEEWREAIMQQLTDISSWNILEQEFATALGNIKGSTQMGIETSDQLASFIGDQVLFKDTVLTLDDVLKKYEAVSLDDLKTVAKEMLQEKSLYSYRME